MSLCTCAPRVSQITAMDFEGGIHLPLGRCLHLRLLSLRLSATWSMVSGLQLFLEEVPPGEQTDNYKHFTSHCL